MSSPEQHQHWQRTIGIGAFRVDLRTLATRLEMELETEFPGRHWAVQLDMRWVVGDQMSWRIDVPLGYVAEHVYLSEVLASNVTPVYQALFDSIEPPPEGCDPGREFIVRVWGTNDKVRLNGSKD